MDDCNQEGINLVVDTSRGLVAAHSLVDTEQVATRNLEVALLVVVSSKVEVIS